MLQGISQDTDKKDTKISKSRDAHLQLGAGLENGQEFHQFVPKTDKIRAILGKIRRACNQ